VQISERLLLDDDGAACSGGGFCKRKCSDGAVVIGGLLSAHKGINLPGVRLRIAGFTEKDEADLAFANVAER